MELSIAIAELSGHSRILENSSFPAARNTKYKLKPHLLGMTPSNKCFYFRFIVLIQKTEIHM